MYENLRQNPALPTPVPTVPVLIEVGGHSLTEMSK